MLRTPPAPAGDPDPEPLDLPLTACLGGHTTFAARLGYDPARPYEITLNLQATTGWIEWVFARDLLADGLIAPAGAGDVRLHPDADDVVVELRSPNGQALIVFGRAELEHALEATEDLVLPGAEEAHVDWRQAWASLGGAA